MGGQATQRLRLHTRFDGTRNEALFARRVLLVEGPGERAGLRCVPHLFGTDFDAEGLSIIDTEGKPGMLLISQVLAAFGIPHVCLVDDDAGKPTGPQLSKQIEAVCGTGNLFVMRPDFEGELGLPTKLSPVDSMQLFSGYTSLGQIPQAIVDAINRALSL